MKFKRTVLSLAVASAIATLTACGGGGGGGGTQASINSQVPVQPSAQSTTQVPFYTPTRVATIDPVVSGAYHFAIVGAFNQDLNNDGSQEIIVAGRESSAGAQTQGSNWVNNRMYLYGWDSNGNLVDKTSQWFAPGDNIIVGTEPSVKFGDFNGTGKASMYVAPSTDGNIRTANSAQIFVNNGSNFTRHDINFGYSLWSHDSTIFRWNGVDNIVSLDYGPNTTFILGSPTNNFRAYSVNNWNMGGSSIAAGNFLGNGTTTFIVTDTGNQVYSTRLFSWNYTGSSVTVQEIGTLPMPIFEQSQYDANLPQSNPTNGNRSHNIRVIAWNFDTNGGATNINGADDAIIISRPSASGSGNWPIGSAIQFLQNNGHGVFTDVTSQYVVNYDMTKPASYNPVIMDVNNDGLLDIILPAQGNTNTQVLLQTREGKFVGTYNNVLTDFANQVQSMQSDADRSNGGTVTFVKGPNGNLYLLDVLAVNANTAQKAIYLSLVGGTQTVNAQATINAIRQVWPYLSPAQANAVIAATGTQYFGATIINQDAIFNPVGNFGLMVNGSIRPINGYINGLKLGSEFNSVKATDALGRDFNVNLSGMSLNKPSYWSYNNEIVNQYQVISHSESLVNNYIANAGALRLGADPKNFTIGIPNFNVAKDTTLGIQYTSLGFNPFIQFGGAYGTVNQSSTVETVLTHYHNEQYATQMGLMYTTTNVSKGLVTDVKPIVSAWAETGYRNNGLGLFLGVKPVVLSGSVDLNLPTKVDMAGNIGYTKYNVGIQQQVIGYARAVYTEKINKNAMYKVSGLVADNGQYRAQLELKINY